MAAGAAGCRMTLGRQTGAVILELMPLLKRPGVLQGVGGLPQRQQAIGKTTRVHGPDATSSAIRD